jgi:hypothetical protein
VNTKTDLSKLVREALGRFQKDTNNRPGDPVTLEKIGSIIEEITGEKLPDKTLAEIKKDMFRRQRAGHGVKNLSNSGDVWSLERWFVSDDE